MTDMTRTFLPVVSKEFIDRVGYNFSFQDFKTANGRFREGNRELYKALGLETTLNQVDLEEVFRGKLGIYGPNAIFMYGILAEKAMDFDSRLFDPGYNEHNLPIVTPKTIKEEARRSEIAITGDIVEENGFLVDLILRMSLFGGVEVTNEELQEYRPKLIDSGMGNVYRHLDLQARKIYELSEESGKRLTH